MFQSLSATALLLITSAVSADQQTALPVGPSPEIVLAKAVAKSGTWFVRVSIPEKHTTGTTNIADPSGRTTGVIVPIEETKWHDYDLAVDGQQVRAIRPDGKAIEPKDLRGRLGRSVRVVLFRGHANPDPYYMSVLRDDVIVLIVPPDRFVSRQAN